MKGPMMRRQIRFSSILVSQSRGLRAYGSFDEVPAPVRRRILAALDQGDSGTILIADRRLRDPDPEPAAPSPTPRSSRWDKRAALELAAAGVIALAAWALATLR
jgi:hypothetical protein